MFQMSITRSERQQEQRWTFVCFQLRALCSVASKQCRRVARPAARRPPRRRRPSPSNRKSWNEKVRRRLRCPAEWAARLLSLPPQPPRRRQRPFSITFASVGPRRRRRRGPCVDQRLVTWRRPLDLAQPECTRPRSRRPVSARSVSAADRQISVAATACMAVRCGFNLLLDSDCRTCESSLSYFTLLSVMHSGYNVSWGAATFIAAATVNSL